MPPTAIPQDVLDAIGAAKDALDSANAADAIAHASAAAVTTAQAQATADAGAALSSHQHAGDLAQAALLKVEDFLGITVPPPSPAV